MLLDSDRKGHVIYRGKAYKLFPVDKIQSVPSGFGYYYIDKELGFTDFTIDERPLVKDVGEIIEMPHLADYPLVMGVTPHYH